MKILNLKNILL